MTEPALRHVPAHVAAGVREGALAQAEVVSRRQLHRLGVTRWMIESNIRADRWRLHGHQSICLHTGDLGPAASRWYAVHEAGPRAAVDGISALQHAGLKGFEVNHVRVSIPRGAPAVRRPGLVVRQTRRLERADVVPVGLPRVRVPVAAVRAALWATSDRQAATILAMVVQQRLCTATTIGEALLRVRRDRRRKLLERTVLDLMGGAEAMGELDVARICRRHRLPAPTRQQVRRTPRGTVYLDVEWEEYDLVLEIDGIHHLGAAAVVKDALRHNDIALLGRTVLRFPVLGLRVSEPDFVEQIRQGLRAGGWRDAA
jgi:very-short-patch-repair endonuclease